MKYISFSTENFFFFSAIKISVYIAFASFRNVCVHSIRTKMYFWY